jgi:ADP-ribose pyrophosphatase
MNVYLAQDLTEGQQQPMEDERIEMKWFSKKKVREWILEGKIQDGKTIVGFYLWLEHQKRK